MKIIKPGRPQKGWAKEFECTGKGNSGGGCGATLLVEEGDLFRTGSHSYDGSSEYCTTFCCEACGVLTDLTRKDEPPNVVSISYTEWKQRKAD